MEAQSIVVVTVTNNLLEKKEVCDGRMLICGTYPEN